jgi:DNA repair protein RecN (Recombination protein N)
MATLQEIGDMLVDIHGQHEHQSLLNVGAHLGLLDSFCSLSEDVSIYGALYSRFSDLSREAAEIREGERERARRFDLLLFQRDEIDQAALSPGEEGSLVAERTRLVHADRLRGIASTVLVMLSDSDTSALAQVGEAVKGVREIAALVPEQSGLVELAGSAEISLREACSSLRAFNDSVEEDPERLEEVAGRLDLIARLKKKYGETVEDIIRFRESLDAEISVIENTGKDLSEIEGMIKDTEAGMKAAAARLTAARNKGASGLSRRVEDELSALGMSKVRFDVRLAPLTAPGPRGCEKAEFLISANPGEAPKPLSKVASGGELSRVMLAIKVVLSRVDELPTLIFDEVDSGVGGETATSVGKKLREAAAGRQVLCITHLPQIASMADEHFMVEKTASGDRTEVAVRKLSRRERVDEIARMLGGAGLKTASAHAEELVRQGGAA